MLTKCSHCVYICLLRKELPMLLLVFRKHAIVESSHQTKHISVMLQMTPPVHIWVNSKHKRGSKRFMTAAHNLPAKGLIKHRTPASCSDCGHKTTIIQRQMQKFLSPTRQIDLFWRHTRPQHCVSKYHSAGLVNSQVYTLQTQPDTRQTGSSGSVWPVSTLLSYSGLWQGWYAQQNTVFTTS